MFIPMYANKKTDKFIHISYDSILICKKSRLHSGTCGWFLGAKKKKKKLEKVRPQCIHVIAHC